MPQIAIVNRDNQKVDEVDLSDNIFRVEMKAHLLHDTILNFLANRRSGNAATKNKAVVRGGGRKPWRQKGTGRARAGSIRSPLWVGGGTIFGPVPRSYAYHVPKGIRRYALKSLLSEKIRDNKLLVLDSLEMDKPSTKGFKGILETLGTNGKVLLAMKHPPQAVLKSAHNLSGVKVVSVDGLNALDLCLYDVLILTRDALASLEERAQR